MSGAIPPRILDLGTRWMRVVGFTSQPLYRQGKKRLLRSPMRRWEENIRMKIWELGWGGVDWMHMAQDKRRWQALVNTVMNLRVL